MTRPRRRRSSVYDPRETAWRTLAGITGYNYDWNGKPGVSVCLVCGRPISRSLTRPNTTGICRKTPACLRAYFREYRRANKLKIAARPSERRDRRAYMREYYKRRHP